MALRLRLSGLGSDGVSFGCSPAYEVLRSLHVLTSVRHHPLHISWSLKVRERMDARLRRDVERFAFWYADRPLVPRGIWDPARLSTWTDDLAALREAPAEEFAGEFIHAALTHRGIGSRIQEFTKELQTEAVRAVGLEHERSVPVMRQLIDDPRRTQEEFGDFLSIYWQSCVEPDWPRLEEQLLAGLTLPPNLTALSPYLTRDGPDLVARPPGDDREPLDVTLTGDDRLVLVPSHFVWPELTTVVQRDRLQTVIITYAVQRRSVPEQPEDLLRLLRSAGDPTRLQILQLLAARDRSTRELAGLIGLTEAAISKHLKLLQDAGWVEAHRRSYYVYYRLLPDAGTRLTRAMTELLDRSRTSAGHRESVPDGSVTERRGHRSPAVSKRS